MIQGLSRIEVVNKVLDLYVHNDRFLKNDLIRSYWLYKLLLKFNLSKKLQISKEKRRYKKQLTLQKCKFNQGRKTQVFGSDHNNFKKQYSIKKTNAKRVQSTNPQTPMKQNFQSIALSHQQRIMQAQQKILCFHFLLSKNKRKVRIFRRESQKKRKFNDQGLIKHQKRYKLLTKRQKGRGKVLKLQLKKIPCDKGSTAESMGSINVFIRYF